MFATDLAQIKQQSNYFYRRATSHRIHKPMSSTVIANQCSKESKDQKYLQRLNKIKQQAQAAKTELLVVTKNYKKLQKQIQKTQKLAHMAKLNCIKLYEIKKHKLLNTSLVQQGKLKNKEEVQKRIQNVKRQKLQEQYFHELIKNQQLYRNLKMKEQCAKYKSIRQALKFKNKCIEQFSKQMYQSIKSSQNQLLQRKKIIQHFRNTKCKQNYMLKLQQQIRKIQTYNQLMAELQQNQKQIIQGFTASKVLQSQAQQEIQNLLNSESQKQDFFLTSRRDTRSATQPKIEKKP